MTVASTSSSAASASSSSSFSCGTDSTIRSCASLIQISSCRNPAYFRGTFSSRTIRADFLAHLPDRAGKAAGAAVGDGGEEAAVAGREDHVGHLLLSDGVADLHGMREFVGVRVGQFSAGKRRAVNPVAPGAAADQHHRVARLRLLVDLVARNEPNAAAEHQRIAEVSSRRNRRRR